MSMQLDDILKATVLGSLLALVVAGPVHAVDGVIEINQARAKVGGVTPGDTPLFPVTISQPGSYRLTGNLDVTDATARPNGMAPQDATAIEVTADNVSIDLNGFTIKGPSVCPSSGLCLTCAFAKSCIVPLPMGGFPIGGQGVFSQNSNVTVTNGTVQGMGADGICLRFGARVDGVSAIGNGGSGIVVSHDSLVTQSRALSNGHVGIDAGIGAIIGNTVSCNRDVGLNLPSEAGYTGNVINNNNQNGNTAPQVTGGHPMPAGSNVCHNSTVCP
jgi:hypothetical protein